MAHQSSSPPGVALPFLGLLKTSSWGAHLGHEQSHLVELVAGRALTVGRFAASAARQLSKGQISAHVTLPAEEGYIVELEVPTGSTREAHAAIAAALPEHVPLPPADTMYNYLFLPERGNQSRLRQTVVSIFPKPVVERYKALYGQIGVATVSFEMDMQAIARAVIRTGDAGIYLIVNIGRESATLAMVAQGAVRMTVSIKTVGKRAAMNLAEAADALYRRFYKESEERGNSCALIRKILLVGSSVGVSDAEGLARAARADVELANVWTNVCSFDDYIPPITFDNSLAYAPSIGAALRRYLPSA